MEKTLIEISNLKISFYDASQKGGQLQVVRGFELSMKRGDLIAVLGETGSGKTVSANAIVRLTESSEGLINEGVVLFDDENLSQMKERQLRKLRGKDIAYIFQNATSALAPYKKIGKQIMSGLKRHKIAANKGDILKALEEVGIEQCDLVYNMYPFQLSGGQNQRIMIAQAILARPKLLIADEPTSSIDATLKKKILNLLRHVKEKYGTAVLMITHDFDAAKFLCNKIVVMYGGIVVEIGDMEDVFRQPLHPYTKGLIQCANTLDRADQVMYTLDGAPPTPYEFEDSCPFYARCSERGDACKEKIPDMIHIGERKVRCIKVSHG